MKKLLFLLTDGEQKIYGHIIAQAKNGDAVFEPRGGGEIRTVSYDQLEEVRPYTIGVKFSNYSTHTTYHYYAREGDWKVGDIIVLTDQRSRDANIPIVKVTKIDSKSSRADKWISGFKVEGKYIPGGDNVEPTKDYGIAEDPEMFYDEDE